MGLYTGANKAFSTPPCHPVPATLGKISIDSFLKQCFSYQSIYLPSLHDHREVIEMCMTGSCEYSNSRKLIWVMTSHKYCSKLKNHHFAVPFLCLFLLYQSHMANLETSFILLPGMSVTRFQGEAEKGSRRFGSSLCHNTGAKAVLGRRWWVLHRPSVRTDH